MLRTTVIAKTDWVRSTEHLRRMSSDELDALIGNHKQMVVAAVDRQQGSILKGEGDAFWITFPSVTAAALAAVEMQRELRLSQVGRSPDMRLSMRVAIAVGDLLWRDDDLFGVAMSLTARIEGAAPADEIYLSHGAWLLLNHAQVKTSFAGSVLLKGFEEPERLYRVHQEELVSVEMDQVVVSTDLGRFTNFLRTRDRKDIANALVRYEETMILGCAKYHGKLRSLASDMNLLTFESAIDAIGAAELMAKTWQDIAVAAGYDLPLRIGINSGDCYVFRTHWFGEAIHRAAHLALLNAQFAPGLPYVITCSGAIFDSLQDTSFANRLQLITEVDLVEPSYTSQLIITEKDAYWLLSEQ